MYWLLSLSGALLVAVILTVLLSGAFAPRARAKREPAEEPVTAQLVRKVRFSLAFRGYSPREVDEFLDRAAQRIAELEEERG